MTYQEKYKQWLLDPFFDLDTRYELGSMKNPKEIEDCFYKDIQFGTGGLRAIMGPGTNRLNKYTIGKVTAGLGDYLLNVFGADMCKNNGVVIGYDTRHNSHCFAQIVADVLTYKGIKVLLYSTPCPTPQVSYSIRLRNAIAGVVITASHNSKEYNGYKVYDENGCQLVPKKANIVTKYINKINDYREISFIGNQNILELIDDTKVFIKSVLAQSCFNDGNAKEKLKIVYTPLHGTGKRTIPEILKRDGFNQVFYVTEQMNENGDFPTVKVPNPEDPKALIIGIKMAKLTNSDILIGTDPDADRIGVAVKTGNEYVLLTGNQVGALLMDFILKNSQWHHLKKPAIVKTIVTSELGAKIAEKHGLKVFTTLTGFKYIGEKISQFEFAKEENNVNNEYDFVFGYEESFGYLMGNHARDKDASVAALLICEMAAQAKAEGLSLVDILERIYSEYGYYFDKLESFVLNGKDGSEKIQNIMELLRYENYFSDEIQEIIDYKNDNIKDSFGYLPKTNTLKFILKDGSWIAIRPSGTEPKIKIYYSIRSTNKKNAEIKYFKIRNSILEKIGLDREGNKNMNILLLSGGSGKRLWPLSNDIRSKQFIKLFKDESDCYESMVQRVYRQILSVDSNANITIATGKKQVSAIKNQLGDKVSICVEPSRRDTFPAIVLATAYLHDVKDIKENDVVIVCPVDPYVDNSYYEAVKELQKLAEDGSYNLTLMGIEPTYPSEKYGYIIPTCGDSVSSVKEFKEKPDVETARKYLKEKALWNTGIFAFKIGHLLKIAHELIEFRDYEDLLNKYEYLDKISFDYAVVEKESNIQVLRYNGAWKDVGTWNMMSEVMSDSTKGNVVLDDTCENTNVINELNIPILCMGCKNMVVAASGDGILISDKERSGYMKPFVEKIETEVMFAEKSWGNYTVIDATNNSMTIKIFMKAGEHMSYHSHEHRKEIWTILSGNGQVIIDGIERMIRPGDIIELPIGSKHMIKANSDLDLIEVQIGKNISIKDKTKFNIK